MAIDLDKLIKLMMMTTSSNDHEALVALRKANAMLAENNQNWEEFERARKIDLVALRNRPPPAKHYPSFGDEEMSVAEMFDFLLATVPQSSSFREFIDDVHEFWKKRGFVTDRQHEALRRAVERAAR